MRAAGASSNKNSLLQVDCDQRFGFLAKKKKKERKKDKADGPTDLSRGRSQLVAPDHSARPL